MNPSRIMFKEYRHKCLEIEVIMLIYYTNENMPRQERRRQYSISFFSLTPEPLLSEQVTCYEGDLFTFFMLTQMEFVLQGEYSLIEISQALSRFAVVVLLIL